MDFENHNAMQLIIDIAKCFRDKMRTKSEALGLVDAYRPIFIVLNKHNGCTQLDICNYTQLKAPTISLTLQKMEASGFIERKVNVEDKRNMNIFLTDKGLALHDDVHRLLKETEEEFFKDISNEEIESVKNILLKFMYNVGFDNDLNPKEEGK